MKLSRFRALALGLSAAAALSGCASSPAHRYFQPSANQLGPYPNSYGEAVIPHHGLIVVQGDDFAYGLARGRSRHRINGADQGQAAITISQTLRKVVRGVEIDNRGFPGDTLEASAVRWQDAARPDLLILCLGYGDATAYTPLDEYRAALKAVLVDAQAHGTPVFVVLPPRLAGPYANQNLDLYRYAARAVGEAQGAEVFDAMDSLARIKAAPLKTAAQTAQVYQAVAADLVPYIRVVDAPSPQTGQAGSADSRTVRVSAASAS